ncbi:apoptosis antagonizing transcription factor domain-containing protein [Sarocladium implicatum]|nr:apoptosis antagonizing transcription factor domain-containing protein [Sarocladium implicatum]
MAITGRRAKALGKPDERIVKDYDPEADGAVDRNSNDSDSDDSEAENAGTEHYVQVGKSKLRRKEDTGLGPQYRGSRVSRDALEDSDEEDEAEEDEDDDDDLSDEDDDHGHYADPDLVDLEADEAAASDSEIDSDNAFTESDRERLSASKATKSMSNKGRRASAADFMSSSDEADGGVDLEYASGSSDEDMDDGLEDLVNGGADDSGHSEAEEDGGSEDEDEDEDDGADDQYGENDEAEANVNKESSSEMSAETRKGLAIQQQRKTYDGLLNMRIRLQKALVAANSFAAVAEEDTDDSEPYAAAEEAAVNLLNTMSNLRDSFTPSSRPGSKRKRAFDLSTSSEDIWAGMQTAESQLSKQRHDLLEKWSRKTQGGGASRTDGKMSSKDGKRALTRALRDQLNDTEGRLVKRTKVPRSCAPAQAAQRLSEDDNIYDDADFYQLLLKELVDQRTVESSTGSALHGPTVMLAAAKDAKTRRDVDRKASKGRKMRFTVHEKLQNFMAPEDRRSWEPAAIDRLFGTLFGQKVALNEEEDVQSDEEDADLDVSGLRLFG